MSLKNFHVPLLKSKQLSLAFSTQTSGSMRRGKSLIIMPLNESIISCSIGSL
jgi:hypothetical protein